MINQVDFEGYLTRAWEYREQRYMRLANYRPGEDGQTASDYITVRIDSALDFDPRRVKVGYLLRVTGRIIGRDIVEPLKLVVGKSHDGVELPGELSNLVIRRPTVQILATQVKVQTYSTTSAGQRKAKRAAPRQKVNGEQTAEALAAFKGPVPIQPGQDLVEAITTA